MNRVLGVGLSVLLNAAIFAALQWNDSANHAAPSGEVHITELNAQPSDGSYAWLFAETRA